MHWVQLQTCPLLPVLQLCLKGYWLYLSLLIRHMVQTQFEHSSKRIITLRRIRMLFVSFTLLFPTLVPACLCMQIKSLRRLVGRVEATRTQKILLLILQLELNKTVPKFRLILLQHTDCTFFFWKSFESIKLLFAVVHATGESVDHFFISLFVFSIRALFVRTALQTHGLLWAPAQCLALLKHQFLFNN